MSDTVRIYYVARSKRKLEDVCSELADAFELPSFVIDCHDTWRYGWSKSENVALNVTRDRGYRVIETWVPNTPSGMNYQILVESSEEAKDTLAILERVLRCKVHRF